ncbi:MAG: hypothetical protein ACP5PV_00605 [Methanothrix sp.]
MKYESIVLAMAILLGEASSSGLSFELAENASFFSVSETLGPIRCPSIGKDVCEAYYDVSYEWPSNNTTVLYKEQRPYIRITNQPSRPYDRNDSSPPYKVTTTAAIIDGIKGTITNVSRFSNVDDAIRAEILLDPAWANDTADQALTRDYWLEYGSLDGEWLWMEATYDLSERGNGASGIVQIYGNGDGKSVVDPLGRWTQFKMTPSELMHVINTIHVTEMRHYAKYTGEETVEVRTIPTYDKYSEQL